MVQASRGTRACCGQLSLAQMACTLWAAESDTKVPKMKWVVQAYPCTPKHLQMALFMAVYL